MINVLNENIPYLIFTKQEIQDMLDFCTNNGDDNVCLIYDDNEIGTVYGLCKQEDLINKEITKINFKDITDIESW